MNKKLKVIIYTLIVIVLIAAVILWFYNPEMKHIEDTNGADNYSLTTITDKNIVKLNTGCIYEQSDADEPYDNKTQFDMFSGVCEIFGEDYKNKDFQITVKNISVSKGNLRVVLLLDNQIVHEFKLNYQSEQLFELNNATGHIALRIAGESANLELEYYCETN